MTIQDGRTMGWQGIRMEGWVGGTTGRQDKGLRTMAPRLDNRTVGHQDGRTTGQWHNRTVGQQGGRMDNRLAGWDNTRMAGRQDDRTTDPDGRT